jgi:hypothetical protein
MKQSSTENRYVQANSANSDFKCKKVDENGTVISGTEQVSVAGSCKKENKPSSFFKVRRIP